MLKRIGIQLGISDMEVNFLSESNAIEDERTHTALIDSIKAWQYAKENKNDITLDYILNIHKLLMNRLCPDIAGKLRDCDVWIGGRRCRFINKKILERDLNRWAIASQLYNKETKTQHKIYIKNITKSAHVQFERIHPFVDGNGRTGRILMNAMRVNAGLPILVIHEGKEQALYYHWFNENNKDGE